MPPVGGPPPPPGGRRSGPGPRPGPGRRPGRREAGASQGGAAVAAEVVGDDLVAGGQRRLQQRPGLQRQQRPVGQHQRRAGPGDDHAAASRHRWRPGGGRLPAVRCRPAAARTARARRSTWWGLLTGVAARRSAVGAGRARLDTKAAVDGGAEGLLAGIVRTGGSRSVGRVGVAEAQVGVGEAERAAGAVGAERAVAGPEGAGGAELEEAGGYRMSV